MLTEKQKAERRQGIGGSDIHHVFSLPDYGCRRWLFYDKRNVEPDYTKYINPAMERGNEYEDFVAKKFMDETGMKLIRWPTIVHPDLPWCRINVDRKIVGQSRGVGVWECKVPGREVFHQIKREGIADSTIMQANYYMFGLGDNCEWAEVSTFWADGMQHIHVPLERDQGLIDSIISECEAFWGQVENGPAPDRLDPKDKRCKNCEYRNQCQGAALLAEIEEQDTKDLPVVSEIDALVPELLELEDIRAAADHRITEIKDKIKNMIGKRDAVMSEGQLWYYRAHVRNGFNTKQFRKDHPQLAEKYNKPTTVRALRRYPK